MSSTPTPRQFQPYLRLYASSQRKPTLFWVVGITIYCTLIVAIYPSVKNALNINLIPANLRTAFNINDFSQLASFLSSELFGVILPLLLPFYGAIALSNVVAGAEERGRLDLLLGNPLPRRTLVIAPFLTVAAGLLILVTVVGVVLRTMAWLLDLPLPNRNAWEATFAIWPLCLAFGALSLALSALVRQRSVALGATAATIFLMFLANVIGKLAPPVSWVRYASAYNAYGNAVVDGLSISGVVVLLAITVALVALAVVAFNRRDIYA